MFSRILIANRGEIALRIVRACREMGVEAVCVHSEADADGGWLDLADESICIGPAAAAQSYLSIPSIIAAAEIADVEAIHPGYGFLAENSHFAEVCRSSMIEFIGPTPEAIDAMGNKSKAKEIAVQAGVPVTPGSDGPVETEDEAQAVAREIGYPVIIKASAGGGGRGMRVAHNQVSLGQGLLSARSEAAAAFASDEVYIEKFIEKPRHVEVQILADRHGEVVHLGERDCSVQRRHQKLIEEAPSPALDEDLRRRMGEAAVSLAKTAGYTNAGTVEFLLDKNGDFYFMEMNARIQVEHPVTEMVTGVDLIKSQLRVAAGERLGFTQDDVTINGHSIELRINAEDPDADFKPSPGRVEEWRVPGGPGVRIDTHLSAGRMVPPHYDSMVAKLIIHRETREEALATAKRALQEFHVAPLKTTVPLHLDILRHRRFVSGEIDTAFLETHFAKR